MISIEHTIESRFIGIDAQILCKEKTEHQIFEVLHNNTYGKILKLNNKFTLSEIYEHTVFEAFTHPALFAHHDPKKILIFGGGNGCIAKHVLKHSNVEKVVILDIDKQFIQLSMEHLSTINNNSLIDKKVEIYNKNIDQYLNDSNESFDIIIFNHSINNTTYPISEESFYHLNTHLNYKGIVIIPLDDCTFLNKDKNKIIASIETISQHFRIKSLFGITNPLTGIYFPIISVSNSMDISQLNENIINKRIKERNILSLETYNSDYHIGLFKLPQFYKTIISSCN